MILLIFSIPFVLSQEDKDRTSSQSKKLTARNKKKPSYVYQSQLLYSELVVI